MEDRWLTIDEVAKMLHLSRGALAQMRYEGRGPAYSKPSPRRVLYRESVVVTWLESLSRTSTADAA